jgi:hypothetical protein
MVPPATIFTAAYEKNLYTKPATSFLSVAQALSRWKMRINAAARARAEALAQIGFCF